MEKGPMQILRVGVDLLDKEFQYALLKAISHVTKDMQLYSINEVSSVSSDGNSLKGLDVLLTDTGRYPEEEEQLVVIYLTYREIFDVGQGEAALGIYRYESADIIAGKILEIYSKKTGAPVYERKDRKADLISFFSIRGGVGVTSAALSVGRVMHEDFDSRVLYVPISPIDGSVMYTGKSPGNSILSLVYGLSSGREMEIMNYTSEYEGIRVIKGNGINRSMAEAGESAVRRLLTEAGKEGFDDVVIDIGSSLGTLARKVIDESDAALMVGISGDRLSEIITERIPGSGNVINVTESKGGREEDSNEGLSISFSPEAFTDTGENVDIDLRGRYGTDIRRISRAILGAMDG